MLRRPTRSPETLLYAKRKPRRSGAFLVNTNLPSCTDCWAR
jgi:hypothetical protein